MNRKLCALLMLLAAGVVGTISGCDKPNAEKGTTPPAQPTATETPAQAPANTTDTK